MGPEGRAELASGRGTGGGSGTEVGSAGGELAAGCDVGVSRGLEA